MSNLLNALSNEILKARRSLVSWVTLAGCMIIPFAGGFLMLIAMHPEKARSLGILSTKAQLIGVTANWNFFFTLLVQAIAAGGMIIFSFIAAWVFGREYINKTLKDLLALPTSRTTIVTAKFVLITVWSFSFSILLLVVSLLMGWLMNIPGWSQQLWAGSITRFTVSALMAIMLSWVVAFVANVGKSYFPAIGFLVFAVAFGQIAAVLGWGEFFPWAIPAIYSNTANPIHLGAISYFIVIITGLFGFAGTVLWWRFADHAD